MCPRVPKHIYVYPRKQPQTIFRMHLEPLYTTTATATATASATATATTTATATATASATATATTTATATATATAPTTAAAAATTTAFTHINNLGATLLQQSAPEPFAGGHVPPLIDSWFRFLEMVGPLDRSYQDRKHEVWSKPEKRSKPRKGHEAHNQDTHDTEAHTSDPKTNNIQSKWLSA